MADPVMIGQGSFDVTNGVWFSIAKSVEGHTILSLNDVRVNRRYSIAISRYGRIFASEIAQLDQQSPADPGSPQVPDLVPLLKRSRPRRVKHHAQIPFGVIALNDLTWFDVREMRSGGTGLSVCDAQTNRRYTLVINRIGQLKSKTMAKLFDAPVSDPVTSETAVQNEFEDAIPPASVHSPVGTFCVSDHLELRIGATAIGPEFMITDRRMRRQYSIVLNPNGSLASREVTEAENDRARAPQRQQEPGRLTAQKHAGIKFIVQHGQRSRPRNTFFCIAAYACGNTTYLLVRNIGGRVNDSLARLIAPDHIVLADNDDPNRLLASDWPSFCDLPPGAQLKLNERIWEKLHPDAIDELVGGRVLLRLAPSEAPPVGCQKEVQ